MTDYPPADDRLRHLLAQEINTRVDTWKLAFAIAGLIVDSPDVRAEIDRIGAAHAAGQPCGDRNCLGCFETQIAAGVRDAARQAAGQPAAEERCTCGHDPHAPGTECEAGVEHGPNRWHRCLCLNRPTAALACPPAMTCQGGTLGYSDVWHLQRRGDATPAVGGQDATQPTAAHPPRERWRLEVWEQDRWIQPRPYPHDSVTVAEVHRAAWLQRRPDARTRVVRETTTWTVEDDTAAGAES